MKLRRLARVNDMVYRNDINILAEWIARHMVDDKEKYVDPKVARDLAEEIVEFLEKKGTGSSEERTGAPD
jgi:hypothetical protein